MKSFITTFLLCTFVNLVSGQIINTVAGNGGAGPLGDAGPAINANLGIFASAAVDDSGNIYIADINHERLRKVSATSGIINTIAGTGVVGYSGDSALATLATFNNLGWVTIDQFHNIYVTDGDNQRVRKIDAITGIITTIAGNGTSGFSGDGGPAINAQLHSPIGIAIDKFGNLYISDAGNQRIRKVDVSGIISTICGNGNIAYSGDGGPATLAEIKGVYGVCTDTFGNVYLADQNDNRVRKINVTTGIINTVAGTGSVGSSGDEGNATMATLHWPYDVKVDNTGYIYISDRVNNKIRKVDILGIIHTVAGNGNTGFSGDGGGANSAELNRPQGIALDHCNNLYIADAQNARLRKVIFNPNCSLIDTTDTTTAVYKLAYQNNTSVYPNPAKEQLSIACASGIKELRVLNTIGQVLIEQKNYSNKAVIDVSALSRGIYFIKVSGKNGVEVVRRFLKE